MTVRVSWLYPGPSTGAAGQSRADTRLSPIGTMWPTGDMTTRSGLIPGLDPMALSGAGMTATIGLGRAVVQGTSVQGAYAAAVTAPHAVTLANGNATNPRIDVIVLRIRDHPYDASTMYQGTIEVVQGTAAGSPVVPAMPSPTTLPLYRITVPAGASAGTGGLVWGGATDLRAYTVSAGGILPEDPSNADGSYGGQVRIIDGRLHHWDGVEWTEFTLPSILTASTWGAWTSYTPVWTGLGALGAAAATGRWCRTGRRIDMAAVLTAGAGTSLGPNPISVSLPVAAAAGVVSWHGTGRSTGGPGSWRALVPVALPGGVTATVFGILETTGGLTSPGGVPYVFGSGDSMIVNLTYEAAS